MRLLRTLIASFILVRSTATFADPVWTEALIESAPVYLKADPGKAAKHVDAALYASQQTGVSPEILLGIAYVESRYFSHVVSRMECVAEECRRIGGLWRSQRKASTFQGPYYCGALQVGGRVSWARCQALISDLRENYLVAARHLQAWLDQPICHGNLRCALLGNGGGFPMIKRNRSTYPQRCTRIARLIRRHYDWIVARKTVPQVF